MRGEPDPPPSVLCEGWGNLFAVPRFGAYTLAMKLRLPHPFVLLLGGVVVCTLLTWVLPAGEYQRRQDAELGREVVVAGTYAPVEAAPVGLMAMLLSVPRGISTVWT